MRMVIRSTGNVQVRKVYLTQFCDMKSIVALYCSSHSTRLDRWLSWWYPVYILLNPIHCFWTRTTQRVFPFNFYLCNCTYFHVQYPPCRKLWNCGKAPEFELWPALILKEESTKEEEEEWPKKWPKLFGAKIIIRGWLPNLSGHQIITRPTTISRRPQSKH